MNALSMSSTLAFDLPNIAVGLLVVLFLFISVVMILVVLIQRPQGGGLSGAFGSSAEGAGQTAFGAKTGDVLTTATIIIFLVFLTTAVVLNYAVKPSATQEEPEVAAADQPVQETVPPGEEQRVIPVTSDGQPMQSGAGTAAPSQAYITTPEGDAGPEIQVITDPEMLKMLEAGQDPASATPTSEPQPKPKEESTPPAEPPATGEGGDGGR